MKASLHVQVGAKQDALQSNTAWQHKSKGCKSMVQRQERKHPADTQEDLNKLANLPRAFPDESDESEEDATSTSIRSALGRPLRVASRNLTTVYVTWKFVLVYERYQTSTAESALATIMAML